MRPFLLFLVSAFWLSCAQPQPAPDAVATPTEAQPIVVDEEADTTVAMPQEDRSTVPFDENGPRYTWTIVPAPNGTFGFAIYDRGQLYIDQQQATGLGGPDGWKSKMDARTAALAAMEVLERDGVPEGLNVVRK